MRRFTRSGRNGALRPVNIAMVALSLIPAQAFARGGHFGGGGTHMGGAPRSMPVAMPHYNPGAMPHVGMGAAQHMIQPGMASHAPMHHLGNTIKPLHSPAGNHGIVSQTNSNTGKNSGILTQTNNNRGRNSGILTQTNNNRGKNSGILTQTNNNRGRNSGILSQTNNNLGKNSGILTQTNNNRGKNSGILTQTNNNAGKNSGILTQTNNNSGKNGGILTQTNNNSGKNGGILTQTNNNSGKNGGILTQSNNNSGKNGGVLTQTNNNAGKSSGTVNQTNNNSGSNSGTVDQTNNNQSNGQGNVLQNNNNGSQGNVIQNNGNGNINGNNSGNTTEIALGGFGRGGVGLGGFGGFGGYGGYGGYASGGYPVDGFTAAPVAAAYLDAPSVTMSAAAPVSAAATVNGRIVLVNPSQTSHPVYYAIDDSPATLQPGAKQELAGTASRVVAFDRGVGDAEARYTLTEGTYTWTVTEKGWELYPTTYTVTLDNTANGADFHYRRDGSDEMVAAGAARTVSSKFPVVLGFDRGDGGSLAERLLASGTYKIGVTDDAKAVDLLAARD